MPEHILSREQALQQVGHAAVFFFIIAILGDFTKGMSIVFDLHQT